MTKEEFKEKCNDILENTSEKYDAIINGYNKQISDLDKSVKLTKCILNISLILVILFVFILLFKK
jgi:hypothetical protein